MTVNEFKEGGKGGKWGSDCCSACGELLVETVKIQAKAQIMGDIVECGSYRCGATIAMAAAAAYYETGKRVTAFDTWGGLPHGPAQQGFENFADADFNEVVQVTTPFHLALLRGKH